jgi:hypothetical protein
VKIYSSVVPTALNGHWLSHVERRPKESPMGSVANTRQNFPGSSEEIFGYYETKVRRLQIFYLSANNLSDKNDFLPLVDMKMLCILPDHKKILGQRNKLF